MVDPYHAAGVRSTCRRSGEAATARHHVERVAVVTTSYPRFEGDWVGHFVREEVAELEASGGDVTVIAPHPSRVLSAFGPPGLLARVRAFPPRLLAVPLWMGHARNALRRGRFDAVIVHWALPLVWAAPPEARVELVSHGSDVRILVRAPREMRHAVVRGVLGRVSTWRFVSGELMRTLTDALDPTLRDRVHAKAFVRAPALAIPDVTERARDLRRDLGPFHVTVGRLVPSKRVHCAIEHAVREDTLLVVVGDGPERAALERQAARTRARVRFMGELPRREAVAYIAAAERLVLASTDEGCSTVVREARAVSTPVCRL
jgi:teichuronic acid biosynthesis glycosyltransferase TuaC